MRECFVMLKKNGLLKTTTPNVCNLDSKRKWLLESEFYHYSPKSIYNTGHITIVPYWLLVHFFGDAGFKI